MYFGIVGVFIFGTVAIFAVGFLIMLSKFYRKVEQGQALVRNGLGGTKVSFTGKIVIPILHIVEKMDLSVKRIVISRRGGEGLICKDNMRADLDVAFFVRVNKTVEDTMRVAESLGCERASRQEALVELFDAKFSEALKTVGKKFDYVELYTNRDTFKEEILKVIGTDLNGYVLEDAAIDYLEQTNIKNLDPKNILDAEGIKKITELTATQAILSNDIERDKEKTIRKQDVEARETILELDRQQAEAEEKQKREIAEVTAREAAEAKKVEAEERLKFEKARIAADEEIAVAEENKLRQIIVAEKNKQRTEAVEIERVKKDRDIEATERERVVTLAQIEKDKAVEVEKRNIAEVIRERVTVERTVVEQEEKIKDTREFATADRAKQVAVTQASEEAEQARVKAVVAAEAGKEAQKHDAEKVVIEAEAARQCAEKESDARKVIADAKAEEEAVIGLGEARALEAKAAAHEKFGQAEASVIQNKGDAEADIMLKKYKSEAEGITDKAEAMKLFNAAGKDHEEFKLRLNKDLEVELAGIHMQKDVAVEQASIVSEALRSAKIDIVGGESIFFDKIVNSITSGKMVDRTVDNSHVLSSMNDTFFAGDPEVFRAQMKNFTGKFNITSEDLKNLTVSALLAKLTASADDSTTRAIVEKLSSSADKLGLLEENAAKALK